MRPSTGVAFLCTPTDVHVCTDASDTAARANFGSGFGTFGLEKLANLMSGGEPPRIGAQRADQVSEKGALELELRVRCRQSLDGGSLG